MIRRPPRSTLFSLHDALPISVAMTSPAPAHQVCLDLAPDAASAWTLEPPGFMLHALPHGGRLVSHADRKSTRLNSSHSQISYAVFCLKKKKKNEATTPRTCND